MTADVNSPDIHTPDFNRELAAEAITVRIRWFGLCLGYALVNLTGAGEELAILNAILTLGAVYALVDTWFSYRGRVFLSDLPLAISVMEAVFIGMLCYFQGGLDSPFRFYYVLSLLVSAIRHSPAVTWATFALHAASFSALAFVRRVSTAEEWTTLILNLVVMGWVSWACTALTGLIKSAGTRLAELNARLREDQLLLEERIAERTRELARSQALLVQQEKQAAFGLLAAGIAHEVGNPLAAISSLVQMLNRRHDDEYTRERLQMVGDQLLRIQRTLRELVDFSRPAVNEPTLCDVNEVCDAALNIAKYYKRQTHKRIVTDYTGGLPLLRMVRDQMVQVFLNLVLNAIDATEEHGTIELRTRRLDDGRVVAEVCDDGCGIDPAHAETLFEPYFTTKPTGTGLGLFVSRYLLDHAGDAQLALSSPGRNGARTVFSVTFPAPMEAAPRGSDRPFAERVPLG